MPKKPSILFCVLNWGLGHASRSIPLIRELLRQGAFVSIASDGEALHLLQRTFPTLPCRKLPAYGVHYRGRSFTLSMLSQLPKIARSIRAEHRLVQQWMQMDEFDGIISDNRFGCYSDRCQSIFLSHQLDLALPGYSRLPANAAMYYFIRKFNQVWVPDVGPEPNLSGALSHGHTPPVPLTYIGPLSTLRPAPPTSIRWDTTFVLSGPEPQRSEWASLLIAQAATLPGQNLLILGKPNAPIPPTPGAQLLIRSFLERPELETILHQTRLVVCRSGYSSLMDLLAVQKPALLVPTPGQPEQEYLARQLKAGKWFHTVEQNKMDLSNDLPLAAAYPGFKDWELPVNQVEGIIFDFLKPLTSG